jgi:hypothetical protein
MPCFFFPFNLLLATPGSPPACLFELDEITSRRAYLKAPPQKDDVHAAPADAVALLLQRLVQARVQVHLGSRRRKGDMTGPPITLVKAFIMP